MGAEANAIWNGYRSCCLSVDFLGGFRYLNLEEDLELAFNSPVLPPGGPNDTYATFDSFRTRNNFYGGQIGTRVRWNRGRFFGDVTGKVAFGSMDQEVLINGAFATNEFNAVPGTGPLQTFPGGVLTQPSNIGSYSRNQFTVIPEVTARLGIRLTKRLSGFVGYTFLYIDEVARPAGQINRNINASQSPAITGDPGATLVGAAQPTHIFDTSSYWAQGINFGLAFSW